MKQILETDLLLMVASMIDKQYMIMEWVHIVECKRLKFNPGFVIY